jgi:hypothetical protein
LDIDSGKLAALTGTDGKYLFTVFSNGGATSASSSAGLPAGDTTYTVDNIKFSFLE